MVVTRARVLAEQNEHSRENPIVLQDTDEDGVGEEGVGEEGEGEEVAPGPKKAKKAKLDEDMEVQAAIEVQAAMEVHAELHATAVALVEALPGGTHSGPLCELKLGHQPELQRCSLFDAPQGSASALRQAQLLALGRAAIEGGRAPALERAVGCMVGMVVADALGHNFEFLDARDQPREDYLEYPARDDTPGGKVVGGLNEFQLLPGQWTDDASMGLCLADSLLAAKGEYEGDRLRIWFHNWCARPPPHCTLHAHVSPCVARPAQVVQRPEQCLPLRRLSPQRLRWC